MPGVMERFPVRCLSSPNTWLRKHTWPPRPPPRGAAPRRLGAPAEHRRDEFDAPVPRRPPFFSARWPVKALSLVEKSVCKHGAVP